MKRSFVYTLTPDVPQTLHVKATDDQNATLVRHFAGSAEVVAEVNYLHTETYPTLRGVGFWRRPPFFETLGYFLGKPSRKNLLTTARRREGEFTYI